MCALSVVAGTSIRIGNARVSAACAVVCEPQRASDDDKAHITAVIDGDDLPSDRYWNWPRLPHEPGRLEKLRDFFARGVHRSRVFTSTPLAAARAAAVPARSQAAKGAPPAPRERDHQRNARRPAPACDAGPQRRAAGRWPRGLSVGVRHHLIADEQIGLRRAAGWRRPRLFNSNACATSPKL